MGYILKYKKGYLYELCRGIYVALLGVEIYNTDHLLMLGQLKRQSMMTIYGFNVNISKINYIMN